MSSSIRVSPIASPATGDWSAPAAPLRHHLRLRPLRRFGRHRPAVLASLLIGMYLIAAVFPPVVAHDDPLDMSAGPRLYPPNIVNWFGTDEFGLDVFSRVVHGARIAFIVGLGSS